MNIMILLEMAAQAAPDRIAIGSLDGGLTYSQLFERAGHLATALRQRAVEQRGEQEADQHVLYTDVSTPTLPLALFGAAWAGQVFVPVNYRLADDRLRTLIAKQAPALCINSVDGATRIGAIEGIQPVTTQELAALIDNTTMAETDWSFDGEDVAIHLHTSGTSGEPKVAILRQRHLVSYVLGSVEFLGAEEDEATLVSVPPYHIAGMSAILTATYGGRRLVQLPAFEPTVWVNTARTEHITHAMVVPTMLARILEVLEATDNTHTHLPHLRHLSYGGGRMPIPVIEHALRLLPQVTFVNAYGLTETSSSITILDGDDHRLAAGSSDEAVRARLGSVGRALPTVELSIRDALGTEVESPGRGEVWVRGEQVSGEYGGVSVLDDDGWFATKDAGWIDCDGYLFLDGRMDDVIVRGGENLSPGEIEDVLLQHPSIHDATVVGLPDNDWGEVVAAVVVLREGATLDEDGVRAWVTTHLRSSRTPAQVVFRTELPYSETGKILRRVLKAELVP